MGYMGRGRNPKPFKDGCNSGGVGVRCKVEKGTHRNFIKFPVKDDDQGDYYLAFYDERSGSVFYVPEEERTDSGVERRERVLKALIEYVKAGQKNT